MTGLARWAKVLLALAVPAVLLAAAGGARPAAACVLPVVTVSQPLVRAGDTITVEVRDAGGCVQADAGATTQEANLQVTLLSGARSQALLGDADTDSDGHAILVAVVPPDTAPGAARIVVMNLPAAQPTTVTVTG